MYMQESQSLENTDFCSLLGVRERGFVKLLNLIGFRVSFEALDWETPAVYFSTS